MIIRDPAAEETAMKRVWVGKQRFFVLVVIVAAAAGLTGPGPASASNPRYLIVPGKSIGPISLHMTRARVQQVWPYAHRTTTHQGYLFQHYRYGDISVQFYGHGLSAHAVAI